MRWFDGLKEGTIHSYRESTRAFEARFITCSQVSQPIDSLLTMTMKEGETLWSYTDRFWELYNDIGGSNSKVAASTFRIGLLEESGLRKFLTKNLAESMHRLMERIEEYRLQARAKGKSVVVERREGRTDQLPLRPRNNFFPPNPRSRAEVVSSIFKEPIHQILEKIKHEPYFKWLNKTGGDASQRNQSLNCSYHWKRGHTTEDCRVLRDHLNHLARTGHLNDFLSPNQALNPNPQGSQQLRNGRPSLGMIEVIHAIGISDLPWGSKVMTVMPHISPSP